MSKTALIFGSTGLVGSHLINILLADNSYAKVLSFVRNPTGKEHSKLTEHVSRLQNIAELADALEGDDLFICLGTTIKKAGTIEKMEQIDRDLPILIAKHSYVAGVSNVAVVSSIGANENARNYYLRIKGEMERGIRKLDFDNLVIARPSMILGPRKESRFGETFAKFLMKVLGFMFIGNLKKYRGIHAKTIARAMVAILKQDLHEVVYESDELEELGR